MEILILSGLFKFWAKPGGAAGQGHSNCAELEHRIEEPPVKRKRHAEKDKAVNKEASLLLDRLDKKFDFLLAKGSSASAMV
ncbi:MAG TPA: hypothetical protein VJ036_03720 [bacterium]|nr:hypothetical protein [bacterium]